MRHSKRTALTADDVDSALNLRNVEVSKQLLRVFFGFFFFFFLNLWRYILSLKLKINMVEMFLG